MARPETFVCVGCGCTDQQSKRGILRTRCPECKRLAHNAWMADRYKQKKTQKEAQAA